MPCPPTLVKAHRPIRYHGIQKFLVWHALGREQTIFPARAVDPAVARLVRRALGDDLLIVLRRVAVIQRAAAVTQATPDRMSMLVVKGRQHQPALHVDDLRLRTNQCSGVRIRADRNDLSATYRNRSRGWSAWIDGVDVRILEHQLRRVFSSRLRRLLRAGSRQTSNRQNQQPRRHAAGEASVVLALTSRHCIHPAIQVLRKHQNANIRTSWSPCPGCCASGPECTCRRTAVPTRRTWRSTPYRTRCSR